MGRKRIYATPEEKAAAAKERYLTRRNEQRYPKNVEYKDWIINYVGNKFNQVLFINGKVKLDNVEDIYDSSRKALHKTLTNSSDFHNRYILTTDSIKDKYVIEICIRSKINDWNASVENSKKIIENFMSEF